MISKSDIFNNLLFLGSFQSVESSFEGGTVLTMRLCPSRKFILYQSSNSFWLTKANDEKQIPIFLYKIDEKLINEEGFISNSGWVDKNVIFLITTKGSILVYSLHDFAKIHLKTILKHPNGKFLTTADSFLSFIIAGDIDGNLIILSPETGQFIMRKATDIAIKQLGISRHSALIMTGDGSLYSFQIDQQILQDPEFELNLSNLNFKATSIVTSKYTNLAAANSSTGVVFVTNFKQSRIIETKKRIKSLQFGVDSTLFAITSGFVGILFSMQPYFRWYEREELRESCVFTVGRLQFVLSKDDQCFVSPLVLTSPNSYYPICYTKNEVYEIHSSKTNSIIAIKHDKPEYLRSIKHCVSNGTNIFVTGNGEACLLNLQTNEWTLLQHPLIKSVRSVVWWGENIVCAIPNTKMHEFSIKVMSLNNNKLTTIRTIKLPGSPNSMRSDHTHLLISTATSVYLIEKDKEDVTKFDTPATFSDIDTNTGKIFNLMRGRKLMCNGKEILNDVSSFFIDKEAGVLIAGRDDNIYACDTKLCRFRLIGKTKQLLFGGIIPGAFMVPCYDDKLKIPPQGIILSYFADVFSSNVSNIEKTTFLLIPHLSQPYASTLLAKGMDLALTRGKAKEVLSFIRAKPAFFKLPPKPRHKASDVIAQLLGAEAKHEEENDNYITFEVKRDSIIANYAPLCRVVRVEEGFVPAACCAMFALRIYHSNKELIDSGFGVIELPIPKTYDGISDNVLNRLNRNFAETLTIICTDLLKNYKPDLALYVSQIADVALHICLSDTKEPESFNCLNAISNLAPKLASEALEIKDLVTIANELIQCNWNKWAFCVLLVQGKTSDAIDILNDEQKGIIIPKIKSSQYSYLLEK